MSPKDFEKDCPGRLVTITGGAVAYVPDKIPDSLSISPSLQLLHESAMLSIGELRAVIPSLPNPKLFTSPFLRREAVKSSRIEGTKTDVDQLLLFEVSEKKTDRKSTEESIDAQEVLNYVRALEGAIAHLTEPSDGDSQQANDSKDPPVVIDQWLVRSMHNELMKGVRGKDKHPGEYRRKQAFIGADLDLHNARFVPPPEHEVAQGMEDLENFVQRERIYPSLISIALAHYQFETIHPFEDGNGRVGRLLIMLMLIQYELLTEPLLYLSAYFERHREEYNDSMLQVSRRGAWESWMAFFLKGVIQESRDTIARAKALLTLRDTWRDRIEKTTNSTTPLQLVDPLFSFPAIDIPTAKQKLGMTYKSAQKAVEKLESLGYIVETTGQKRNRIYIAKPILELIAADDIPQPLVQ